MLTTTKRLVMLALAASVAFGCAKEEDTSETNAFIGFQFSGVSTMPPLGIVVSTTTANPKPLTDPKPSFQAAAANAVPRSLAKFIDVTCTNDQQIGPNRTAVFEIKANGTVVERVAVALGNCVQSGFGPETLSLRLKNLVINAPEYELIATVFGPTKDAMPKLREGTTGKIKLIGGTTITVPVLDLKTL